MPRGCQEVSKRLPGGCLGFQIFRNAPRQGFQEESRVPKQDFHVRLPGSQTRCPNTALRLCFQTKREARGLPLRSTFELPVQESFPSVDQWILCSFMSIDRVACAFVHSWVLLYTRNIRKVVVNRKGDGPDTFLKQRSLLE